MTARAAAVSRTRLGWHSFATNMGVEATARTAFDLGYDVVIAADACGSVSAEFHAFTVNKLPPRIARVRDTAVILQALGR